MIIFFFFFRQKELLQLWNTHLQMQQGTRFLDRYRCSVNANGSQTPGSPKSQHTRAVSREKNLLEQKVRFSSSKQKTNLKIQKLLSCSIPLLPRCFVLMKMSFRGLTGTVQVTITHTARARNIPGIATRPAKLLQDFPAWSKFRRSSDHRRACTVPGSPPLTWQIFISATSGHIIARMNCYLGQLRVSA